MSPHHTKRCRGTDERGASLILAIVFVFAVGLALVAIGDFATGALRSTSELQSLRSNEANAEAATTVAFRYVQTTYTASIYDGTSPIPSCLPSGTSLADVVYCTQSSTPPTGFDRVVDFYACSSSTSASNCAPGKSGLFLHAQVAYSDHNFAAQKSCSSSTQVTCGAGIVIEKWDVLRADS